MKPVQKEKLDCAKKEVALRQCEVIIREGLEAMEKVDRALDIINDLALYEDTFESFDAYCHAKWHIDQNHRYPGIKRISFLKELPGPQNNITRRKYESRT